jgi:phosphatidylserine/phosphatidylglycerophosphate/cardiolipin synthase-like enzyme
MGWPASLASMVIIALAALLWLVFPAEKWPGPRPEALPGAAGAPAVEALPGVVNAGLGPTTGGWSAHFTRPTSAEDAPEAGPAALLVGAIEDARRSLDLAVFDLDHPLITQALLRAFERGVAIRVVSEDTFGLAEPGSDVSALAAAGIAVRGDGRSALMHHKFMIVDHASVWMGSMNYTTNGVQRNNNNLVRWSVPAIVRAFQGEFERLYTSADLDAVPKGARVGWSVGGREGQVLFSRNEGMVDAIVGALAEARATVHVMAFSLTHEAIGDALADRAAAGIDVQGVVEARNGLAAYGQAQRLICRGLAFRTDSNPYLMHHKVIIIDARVVIFGSFNFSRNASEANDENLMIVEDAGLARLFLEEFARVWQHTSPPPRLACG